MQLTKFSNLILNLVREKMLIYWLTEVQTGSKLKMGLFSIAYYSYRLK